MESPVSVKRLYLRTCGRNAAIGIESGRIELELKSSRFHAGIFGRGEDGALGEDGRITEAPDSGTNDSSGYHSEKKRACDPEREPLQDTSPGVESPLWSLVHLD